MYNWHSPSTHLLSSRCFPRMQATNVSPILRQKARKENWMIHRKGRKRIKTNNPSRQLSLYMHFPFTIGSGARPYRSIDPLSRFNIAAGRKQSVFCFFLPFFARAHWKKSPPRQGRARWIPFFFSIHARASILYIYTCYYTESRRRGIIIARCIAAMNFSDTSCLRLSRFPHRISKSRSPVFAMYVYIYTLSV